MITTTKKTLAERARHSMVFAALAVAASNTPIFVQPSFAAESTPVGSALRTANLVDVNNMIRIADTLDAAVDAKDWTVVRSLFTDEITVDFTSLVGGQPASIPADGLIAGWSNNLKESKPSFHMRSNHRVTFDGDESAVMVSQGYAWNRMESGALPENGGDPLWEVWGTYEHSFSKIKGAWKITDMTFVVSAQRGNEYVRDTIPKS